MQAQSYDGPNQHGVLTNNQLVKTSDGCRIHHTVRKVGHADESVYDVLVYDALSIYQRKIYYSHTYTKSLENL